jgi:hypothetical protein
MGGSIELSGELATTVRQAAAERGFSDPSAYLEWLVTHDERQERDHERLVEIEARLDELESKVDGEAARQPTEADRVQALIDEQLRHPQGANDDDVSQAISEAERRN